MQNGGLTGADAAYGGDLLDTGLRETAYRSEGFEQASFALRSDARDRIEDGGAHGPAA